MFKIYVYTIFVLPEFCYLGSGQDLKICLNEQIHTQKQMSHWLPVLCKIF